MKTLYKIPFLIMVAALIAVGLGYGYNCVADEPLAVRAIPLTFEQRDQFRKIGVNPNDAQLARWGSDDALLRIEAKFVEEMSKRMLAAHVAQRDDKTLSKDMNDAMVLLKKLAR